MFLAKNYPTKNVPSEELSGGECSWRRIFQRRILQEPVGFKNPSLFGLGPILTYACVIWWEKAQQANVNRMIGHLQRLACICITGSMKSTHQIQIQISVFTRFKRY
jgi:hypothetical protein